MADSPAASVARRYFDSVARHDLDEAMACWVPGGIDHLAPVGELRVPDELRAYFEELFAAMPDFEYEVTSLIEQGDRVAVHWRAHGHFTGRPYAGINSNGSTISTEGADLIQVEDGLIQIRDVIDRDLLTCPEDDIKDTRVLQTWIEGKKVYERGGDLRTTSRR